MIRCGVSRRDETVVPSSARRVLLATSGHVGNNLFCTPAIAFLKRRRPDVQFDAYALSRRGASVFARNPHLGKVHLVYIHGTARRLAARYDLVLGLHWDTARDYLAGVSVPTFVAQEPDRGLHRADALLELAREWVGGTVKESDRCYVLNPGSADHAAIERHFGEPGEKAIHVGFHLGSGKVATHGWKFFYHNRGRDRRLWPVDRYVSVAKLLGRRLRNIRPVITGVRNERFLGRAFARALPGTMNLMGKTSLLELAALMTKLDVFITTDNGALHVACAMNVPIVGLFGSSLPGHTGMFPPHPHHLAIKRERMEDIDPDEVADAALRLLAPSPQIKGTSGTVEPASQIQRSPES